MAYIDRASAVLDAISNGTLTNPEMVDLVTNYLGYTGTPVLTNEELAQQFIETLRADMKKKVRRGKQNIAVYLASNDINSSDDLLDEQVP